MYIENRHRTDLLIIGGGPSGLAAAISAKEAGVEHVTLIEKTDSLSGNGKFAMNLFDIYNTKAQKANQIEGSKGKFIASKSKTGEDPARLEVWAEQAGQIDEWLRSFDVKLDYNFNGRGHLATENLYAGAEIARGMERHIENLGVEVRLESQGSDLIIEDNRVLGAQIGYKNTTSAIYAKAVILATGGFANNKSLLAEYSPGSEDYKTNNKSGTTGEYIKPLKALGVQFDKMNKMIVVPAVLSHYNHMLTNSEEGSLFINKEGKRFMNERLFGFPATELIKQQTDNVVWLVVDIEKQLKYPNVRRQIKEGRFISADNLENLAVKMNVPKENLMTTIERYNKHADAQTEDEFGLVPERPVNNDGPYYAVRIEPAIHITRGGIVTNAEGKVMREDGSEMSNLFATGEVTWQSGALSQSIIWGRVAGEKVAGLIK